MRLALPAMLLASLVGTTAAAAQTAASRPVLLASAAAHASPPRAAARLFSRVEVGITPSWPSGETQFADYAVQEIEAGTVSGDLYVRWSAFGPHAASFTVEVSTAGGPFATVATVEASASGTGEHGVHALGLAAGLYEVRMRETAADGSVILSTPVRVRI